MMIIMKANATPQQVEAVIARVKAEGLSVHLSQGVEATIIGAIGETHSIPTERFEGLDGVDIVQRITQPYKLASRQFHPENTVLALDGFTVGGDEIAVIAGPCSVESRSQIIETAQAVKEAGACALRGGVFKPRTSPYSFQGLGEAGTRTPGRSARENGSAHRGRDHVPSPGRCDGQICGRVADRGAQHAELQSPARGWRDAYRRPAQTWTLRHHRRTAHVC